MENTFCSVDLISVDLISETDFSSVFKIKENDIFKARKIYFAKYKKYLKDEIEILVKLKGHKNIVKILDFSLANELSIDLEWLEEDLLKWVYKQDISDLKYELKLKKILRQICEAIQFLHLNKVIHNDLKPENIMIDKRGKIKLIDFGLSEIVTGICATKDCGSILYSSPQKLSKLPFNCFSAEIWALGICFYCLSFKKLPFNEEDLLLLSSNSKNSKYVKLEFGEPKRSNQLELLILNLLSFDPDKRFNINEILDNSLWKITKSKIFENILIFDIKNIKKH
jgi:5'-AMP-activated protein kinase catalytic alpha subunit